MRQLNEHHTFTGLQRDKSPLLHQATHLYDARNVRLSARGGDTLFEVTNEKSSKDTEIVLEGKCVGHATIGKYLVVFTHSNESINVKIAKDYKEEIDAQQKIINEYQHMLDAIVEPQEPQNPTDPSTIGYKINDYLEATWRYDLYKQDGYYTQLLAKFNDLYANWDSYSEAGTLDTKKNEINSWWEELLGPYKDVAVNDYIPSKIWDTKEDLKNYIDEIQSNVDEVCGENFEGVEYKEIEAEYNKQLGFKEDYDKAIAAQEQYEKDEAKYLEDYKEYVQKKTDYGNKIKYAQNTIVRLKRSINTESMTGDIDYIYRIDLSFSEEYPAIVKYSGVLGFEDDTKIDTTTSYESESVQKVYWVDGIHQPRVIDICKDYSAFSVMSVGSNNELTIKKDNINVHIPFDFVREMKLNEVVTITKENNSDGSFPAGVLQYIATYYDKYGQETNAFYVSPLLYTSHANRGGSPEDVCKNTFTLDFRSIDTDFEYIRLYAILRTSLDQNPTARLVSDIKIQGNMATASFVDDGITGSSMDPTELLYKNKSMLVAKTITQKDNTLFLGNIKEGSILSEEDKAAIDKLVKIGSDVQINTSQNTFVVDKSSDGAYPYYNQLGAKRDVVIDENTTVQTATPCSGFKKGNTYRLGIQFQDKYGSWSKPFKLSDEKETLSPSISIGTDAATVTMPGFNTILSTKATEELYSKGYRKARALYVAPTMLDRDVLCQGIVNRVVERTTKEKNGYLQPSWIFRYKDTNKLEWSPEKKSVMDNSVQPSTAKTDELESDIASLRNVEIQGKFDNEPLSLSTSYITLNSPDLDLSSDFKNTKFEDANYSINEIAKADVSNVLSAVNIQTSTPTINDDAAGALPYEKSGSKGFLADTIYEDFLVEDMQKDPFRSLKIEQSPVDWLVYMWHRDGSLNNDMQRPSGQGTQSAKLKKKVVSNLRVAQKATELSKTVQLSSSVSFFDSEAKNIVRLGTKLYNGDIDTILVPDKRDGLYFTFDGSTSNKTGSLEDCGFNKDIDTANDSKNWYMTFEKNFIEPSDSDTKDTSSDTTSSSNTGHVWKYNGQNGFDRIGGKWSKYVGWRYLNTSTPRTLVRMKYKSTPHIVAQWNGTNKEFDEGLPIAELTTVQDVRYGGTTDSAYMNNKWIPCGEAVQIKSDNELTVPYQWGDCYYQQWDCLKTYPYTDDDTNQVVEIASVMIESFVNLDGRYDRNRGLADNTNISPLNFNLLNEVYTQADNFYTYRILPEDMYKNTSYPSKVIWSLQKSALSEIDAYTGIQTSSSLDLDGSKGEVNALYTWKDSLIGFQDRSVSNIQFNSRVEIPSNDGVPIEISNNYKVTGYNEIMHDIGCKSPWLVLGASGGLYFIDSITGHLYRIGDNTSDVSQSCGLSVWSKGSDATMLVYDNVNKDVYIVMDKEVLCYSEVLAQFVSFFDYPNVCLIESYGRNTFSLQQNKKSGNYSCKLWELFEGDDYCVLFNGRRPWYIEFVSNGLDSSMQDMDKIFGNIDYRMDLFDDKGNITNYTFSHVQVYNSYQDTGLVSLTNTVKPQIRMANKKRDSGNAFAKFRTWRIQIPRDKTKHIDRIRDSWCKIKLECDWKDNTSMYMAKLKDLNVQYYV